MEPKSVAAVIRLADEIDRQLQVWLRGVPGSIDHWDIYSRHWEPLSS
jgi:hypothetical protein